ncbi:MULTISPECIES: hypothetical protein [Actinosynnema]|nr:hypothetical protein [Actinosynnema pretiosum]
MGGGTWAWSTPSGVAVASVLEDDLAAPAEVRAALAHPDCDD